LQVNDTVASLGTRVAASDQVRLDGRLVRQRVTQNARTFLCHRSPGQDMAELQARLPRSGSKRWLTVSPMPRIDGGLELLTADGELAQQLQRIVHRLVSEFGVRVRGELTEQALQGIKNGILDSGERFTVLTCESAGGEGSNRWYTLSGFGGSGKAVRQLFERQGAILSRVLRVGLGPLKLQRSLSRGQYQELAAEELAALLSPQAPEPENSDRSPRDSPRPARRDKPARSPADF
jgi:23S rRNA pseudouridine2605 synthase